ncbi:hypothetical protein L3V77_04965 [Vibrio sp. DW001]|uniref:hypothetical protein n=1 Tax=Vibrio sp. DW001 TaxID=2912315 RepID=UPI0023AF7395|nr:hypothetical protein [Vibrio sp. DW001]WED27588.1 hypothetical protein L3V77_04965 [Vibrio sp. DW001]
MQKLIDDFVRMNQAGLILELCEKYYDENVVMLNNGSVFASSMKESYDKQEGFIESVEHFDVSLVSMCVSENTAELTFHYKMTNAQSQVNEFTGKHIQIWKNGKIIKEEYLSVD